MGTIQVQVKRELRGVMNNKDMPKWKEETRADKREWLDANVMGSRMTIHKYVGCGDSLFLSWGYLFSKLDLGTTDWDEAKRLSIEKAKALLDRGINDIAALAESERRNAE